VEVETKEEEEDLIVNQDLNQRKTETVEEDTKREEMIAHLAVQDLVLTLKREEEVKRKENPKNDLKALEKNLKITERTLRIRRIRKVPNQSPSLDLLLNLSPSPAQNLHPNLDLKVKVKARHQNREKLVDE
jgi:hypothetical protein